MTALATEPLEAGQLDMLELLLDEQTPLGKLHMADFRDACETDGRRNDGWVHPSRVSAILHDRFGQIDPNSFAAKWAPACGRAGFMDKHEDELVPIDPEFSRGNGNKKVPLRRLRGWGEPLPADHTA